MDSNLQFITHLFFLCVFNKIEHVFIIYCSSNYLVWHVGLLVHICVSLCRYDSYGRLTNVTYPTGQVSSYRTDSDSSVRIQTEGSNKEDITVTTNLSASGTFYTLMQGECLLLSLIGGTYDIKGVSLQCQKSLLEKKKGKLVFGVRQVTPGQNNLKNCINFNFVFFTFWCWPIVRIYHNRPQYWSFKGIY